MFMTEPFAAELVEDGMKVLGRHTLPDREGESFIAWRNVMDLKSADKPIKAIREFPANLAKLYSTD